MILDSTTKVMMLKTEREKLSGIETGANKYVHPNNHLASMIQQDSTHRFVTDMEKTTWNNNNITANKAAKGYVKFGGIMIQWGTSSASANTNTTVNYAIPFANVYSVVMVPEDSNTSQNKSLAVCSISTSSFKINNTERVAFNCRWIAIGAY